MNDVARNIDPDVAAGFGHEWSTFRQGENELSAADRQSIFECYFHIFPWNELPPHAVGIDVGCGSGRWSAMVAPQRRLICTCLMQARKLSLSPGKSRRRRQCQLSPRKRRRHSAARQFPRFCIFAGRSASRARHGGRYPRYRGQAQNRRAVPGVSLLCAGQPALVVSRHLALKQYSPRLHFATAAEAAFDHQPDHRDCGLLAFGSPCSNCRARGSFAGRHSARVVSEPGILRDAYRRLRPFLYQARAALHATADRANAGGRRIWRHPVSPTVCLIGAR